MAVKCKIRLMLFAKGDAKKGFGVVLTDRPMYYFVEKSRRPAAQSCRMAAG
jgi:hypothetical protein